MSRNYYSEINLHLTWHTKQSLPLLNEQLEHLTYRVLRQKIIDWEGAYVEPGMNAGAMNSRLFFLHCPSPLVTSPRSR